MTIRVSQPSRLVEQVDRRGDGVDGKIRAVEAGKLLDQPPADLIIPVRAADADDAEHFRAP